MFFLFGKPVSIFPESSEDENNPSLYLLSGGFRESAVKILGDVAPLPSTSLPPFRAAQGVKLDLRATAEIAP